MAAGVDNRVSTENLNMALDGNCYHNNISTLQCGNDIMEENFHTNIIMWSVTQITTLASVQLALCSYTKGSQFIGRIFLMTFRLTN